MRRTEGEKCARRKGIFDAKYCRCTEGTPEEETTCVESSESEETETTCVESSESQEVETTCVESSESEETETTCVESSESQEIITTCVESSESNEDTTQSKLINRKINNKIFNKLFLEPTCKCKCSNACKKRNLIIDVLLKYFLRETYDKECCKQECDCPEGSTVECEDSSNESNYDVLVKLFKPGQEGEDVVETTGDELCSEEKEEITGIMKKAIDEVTKVLKSHQNP
jgi:hypothetical protein